MPDEMTCPYCLKTVSRSNFSRHQRRKHSAASTTHLCRGVSLVDVTHPSSTLSSNETMTTTAATIVRRDSEASVAMIPSLPTRLRSVSRLLVDAAQSLLEQRQLVSEDALCDYVRRNFPDILEHELYPLVIGAVAGAQHAAAHHFIVERGRASYAPDMVHLAIRAGANLAIWNMGLARFIQPSSEPFPSAGPHRTSEIQPHSLPLRAQYHEDFDTSLRVGDNVQLVGSSQSQVQGALTRGALASTVFTVSESRTAVSTALASTSSAIIEPYVPPIISTSSILSVEYNPTPTAQLSASGGPPVSDQSFLPASGSAAESGSSATVGVHKVGTLAGTTNPHSLCLLVPFDKGDRRLRRCEDGRSRGRHMSANCDTHCF